MPSKSRKKKTEILADLPLSVNLTKRNSVGIGLGGCLLTG
jgi:hypothetical protein